MPLNWKYSTSWPVLLGALMGFFSPVHATSRSPQAFNFQGRLFNASGTSALEEVISLKFQILDPSASCLLYEETQTLDLSYQAGAFSVSVGSALGAPKRSVGVDPGFSMAKVFKNDPISETRAQASGCPSGYTPTAGDHRLLRVTVTPLSTGIPEILSPDQTINSVPQALVAETLQGLAPSDFIQKDPIYITDQNVKKLFGSLVDGVVDASDLHHHDGRYIQVSSSSSQDLGSGGFNTSGKGSIGSSTSFYGTTLSVKSDADTSVGLAIRGSSGTQIADLFQVQNSAGVPLASISSSGGFSASSTTLSSTNGNQLVVKYNETNKQSIDVSSTGTSTFTAAGTAPKFSFMGGNVGVGKSTPAYPLDVLGDARLGSNGSLRFDGGAGQSIKGWSGRLTMNFGSTEAFRFQSGGFITSQKIGFGLTSGDTGDTYISRQAAGELRVSSDGSSGNANLFVNGKLGVGTNTANQTLTVIGNAYLSGVLFSSGVENSTNNTFSKVNTSTTGTQILRNVADTNPTLVVQQQNSSSTGDLLQVKNSSSTAMTVQAGGNVGIGTTSPNAKLQVKGAITNSIYSYTSSFTCGTSSIDFSEGNLIRLSPSNTISAGSCSMTLTNLAAGGSYTLIVTGNATTNAVTYNFTGYTFKYLPTNSATKAGNDTIYTFLYDGSTVYVTWSGGYQ